MNFKQIILEKDISSLKVITTIVNNIRPGRLESFRFAETRLKELIQQIRSDEDCRKTLRTHVTNLLKNSTSLTLFTQSGILASGSFFSDLNQKIKHSILPPLQDVSQLADVITVIFHKPWDYRWVPMVSNDIWKQIIQELNIETASLSFNKELEEVLNSILILSHRIVALGIDPVLVAKVPDIENLDSPFIAQNNQITVFVEKIKLQQMLPGGGMDEIQHVSTTLNACKKKIQFVRQNKNVIGASMGLTYITHKLDQHISRLNTLLKILLEPKESKERTIISFFTELVFHQNTKNSLTKHFSSNVGLLAYQVTEHAAKTGEHYISNNRKEYFKFLKYSMGGGVIVGFLVIFKIAIHSLHLPPFNEAFVNGLNYGIGFIIIHLCGFTLATKQPAMTASTLAGSLEGHTNDNVGISNLAILIVKISRTQFISFAGNLVMVFPTAWFLSWSFQHSTGIHIADPEKANHILADLHPYYSLSMWYAAIAGVLLFSAGLISGYFDNKTVFNNIPQRIVQHPGLKFVSLKRREKIAGYIGNNLGSLAGNFILGFLLASMAFLGFILGLPLDVRHVTFVTGNFGLALQSLDNQIPMETMILTIISIVLIGFTNFIVSFSLAIFTAIKARQVKFRQTWKLVNLLKAYFFTYPFDFFFPPKNERQVNLIDDENHFK